MAWTMFWQAARRGGDLEPVAVVLAAGEGGVGEPRVVDGCPRIRNMGLEDLSVTPRQRTRRA